MKAIIGRLWRLERNMNPPECPEARRCVELLLERRRRNAVMRGERYQERPPTVYESARSRPRTIAEALRWGRQAARAGRRIVSDNRT